MLPAFLHQLVRNIRKEFKAVKLIDIFSRRPMSSVSPNCDISSLARNNSSDNVDSFSKRTKLTAGNSLFGSDRAATWAS
jgi:hypothetical protein